MTKFILYGLISLASRSAVVAQAIPARWDELTASDWPKALKLSDSTCILPIGVLEKHGPHAPIGTDLIRAREYAAAVVKKEYAVVFPDYFYGQINEARHQPGTFALPERVLWDLLEATCDEIGRNGFRKILLVNTHGGNPDFLRYFMQTRLHQRHPYALFLFAPTTVDSAFDKKLLELSKGNQARGYHAGQIETSEILYERPELVHLDRAEKESGIRLDRLNLKNMYTPIWWYAGYPNHYDGDGSRASVSLGKFLVDHVIGELADVVKQVKADRQTLILQEEFYKRVERLNHP